ncbi:ABC transporter ATP-binding protein [Chloroflexota bacterium]
MKKETKTILEVQDLRTYFFTRRGIVKAVDGVSFSLQEGETLGVIGESGCGKTITCLSIIRLVPEPAGRIVGGKIIFEGEDLIQKSEGEMTNYRGSKISMILQDPMVSLNPVFSIGYQVAEAIRIHQRLDKAELKEKCKEVLRMVKIPAPEQRLHAYPHQMSGGMRQRVVGAMAISCLPKLLIADEPTTSLDVTIQAQYLDLLKEIQLKTKVSMIFVTHNFGIVARSCDKAAVMYAGKIIENASTQEIFDNPVHPYTAGLMASLPRLEDKAERLFSIPGQPPALNDMPAGCSFSPRCQKVMDICRSAAPSLVTISGNHSVRCWLAGKH